MPIEQKSMPRIVAKSYRTYALVLGVFVSLGFPTARAQVAGPVTRTDLYGNVQPIYRERRSVGVFQNAVQEQMLRSYQDSARRPNRRGGLNPFTLPGDLRRRGSDFLLRLLFTPPENQRSLAVQQLLTRERDYRKYGGFGRRQLDSGPDRLRTVLERRATLIRATAFNAPINRTGVGAAGGLTLRPPLVIPSANQPELLPQAEAPPTLQALLAQHTQMERQWVQANAWTDFQQGDYRRAARRFETVAQFDPDGAEAYLGEMFCHLALGSPKTAYYLFRSFVKRAPNPFALDLNVAERFSRPADTLRIRMESRALFEGAEAHPDLRAMHTIILWYLGSRNEARVVLSSLAKEFPNTRYAPWISLMPSELEGREGPSRAVP